MESSISMFSFILAGSIGIPATIIHTSILTDVVAAILNAMSKNHLIEGRQRPTVIVYDTTTVSSRTSS